MPACDSCAKNVRKRQWCHNNCGAKLCPDCEKLPEGWPADVTYVHRDFGHGVKWAINQCRFCRRRGEPMTGAEFKKLGVGDWFWVLWCKDGNPEDLRFNCPQRIVEYQEDGAILTADWSFTSRARKGFDNEWGAPDRDDHNSHDTSRGAAYFFHFLES